MHRIVIPRLVIIIITCVFSVSVYSIACKEYCVSVAISFLLPSFFPLPFLPSNPQRASVSMLPSRVPHSCAPRHLEWRASDGTVHTRAGDDVSDGDGSSCGDRDAVAVKGVKRQRDARKETDSDFQGKRERETLRIKTSSICLQDWKEPITEESWYNATIYGRCHASCWGVCSVESNKASGRVRCHTESTSNKGNDAKSCVSTRELCPMSLWALQRSTL